VRNGLTAADLILGGARAGAQRTQGGERRCDIGEGGESGADGADGGFLSLGIF